VSYYSSNLNYLEGGGMTVALAATHHDADGRLYDQTARIVPLLHEIYSSIVILVTPATLPASRSLLQATGAHVSSGGADLPQGHLHLGLWRRLAIEQALVNAPQATHIHFCDFDRVLHWAEYYPDELRLTLDTLSQYDFTVLGRTRRAFDSHPRIQRDTEGIVNHVFVTVSGLPWDVTAASRGLSRRAAQHIVAGCRDDTVGSDCSWPLLLQRISDLRMGYCETEGLEFETLDRYADELETLGGAAAWIARTDTDPQNWAFRLELARLEVAAVAAYSAERE
jgi:hypothetical protein